MGYYENRKRAQTVTIGTTKTDQSSAGNTDINILMRQHQIHGQVPGSAKPPIYGDFSEIPDNLRDMLELSKSVEWHKGNLPPALQDMTIDELVRTDPRELQARINTEGLYIDRHAKLPKHLKNLSRADILQMTEKEFTDTITPREPPVNQEV